MAETVHIQKPGGGSILFQIFLSVGCLDRIPEKFERPNGAI
jgi:hypothetical protein